MTDENTRSVGSGLFLIFLLLGPAGGSSTLQAQQAPTCPNPSSLIRGLDGAMAHVRFLADDALGGRETGMPGARCAADYIAAHFRELGLQGAGADGSFFQTFQVQVGSQLGEENTLEVNGGPLELGGDWIPFGFSAGGSVTGDLVYGGPGVSMPGDPEDRYAHLDIQGKIVVVEGGDPHQSDVPTISGEPHHKASIAAGRGAAGILILLPEGESLPRPESESLPALKIPAAGISGPAASSVREAAQSGGSVNFTATLDPRMVEARNVVALLPGTNPSLAREVVVVGAHYDHLGFGGGGSSLAPGSGEVHNGADDNASGTGALLEVARRLVEASDETDRSVLFIAFTGEEKGLWGSAHYVQNPLAPLQNTVSMINMDMVGRLRENTLTVYGTGTAEEFPSMLQETNRAQPEPFELSFIPDGVGASDHNSFYLGNIPVLMLFTNTHPEYHRPDDDWDLINAPGLERIAAFATAITGRLAGQGTADALALTFQEAAGNPHGAMAAAAEDDSGSQPRSFSASMGTIPDMTPRDFGVRVAGVREGSAAEKAGLMAGDILVEFAGHEITDLYAYTYALREHKPGDEVEVVVIRDGERLHFKAVLGQSIRR